MAAAKAIPFFLLIAALWQSIVAAVPAPLAQDLAAAALAARKDFRLELFLKKNKFPTKTHFDNLEWSLGFTELWIYQLRNACLALWDTPPSSDMFDIEEQLLVAASKCSDTNPDAESDGGQKALRKAWKAAQKMMDKVLPNLREIAALPRPTAPSGNPSCGSCGNATTHKILSNGLKMPSLGLGTTMLNGEKGEEAIRQALELGYRMIDTAQAYENEMEVGRAVVASGIPRKEIFIATKLSEDKYCAKGQARQLVERQLQLLQTDYIDLYMLHDACPGRVGAWKDLEQLYGEGIIKSLGVSNFDDETLEAFNKRVKVQPHIVQNKFSVYHQGSAPNRAGMLSAIEKAGAVLMGYCNLDAYPHVIQPMEDAHVKAIASAKGKTAAQVLLRHALQRGTIVIPKSARKERLQENAAIFDFELSDEEMEMLDSLAAFAHVDVSDPSPPDVEKFFKAPDTAAKLDAAKKKGKSEL